MSHPPPSTLFAIRSALLLLLACVAGYVDALSYLGLGRVFTANMTGNTVLFGIALVHVDIQAAIRSGLALAGFLAGGALGAWVVERDHRQGVWPSTVTVALSLEGALLLAFALGWQIAGGSGPSPLARFVLIALSALAMGVQSAAARRLDVLGIATTYMTGTLTSLVTHLVRWRPGARFVAPPRTQGGAGTAGRLTRSARSVALLAAVWFVYIGGAAAATAAPILGQVLALVFPVALILIVISVATLCFRQR